MNQNDDSKTDVQVLNMGAGPNGLDLTLWLSKLDV